MKFMIRTKRIVLPFSIIMAVAIVQVSAQDYDHEGGFFLRLSAGGGGASTEFDDGSSRLKLSGGAGDVNFAIGGIVASNLALHGTLYGWTISAPDVESNLGSGQAAGDLTLGAFGAGVTYYFMPANIYISGTLGIGQLQIENGTLSGESQSGLATDITVGKEWWVGTNWGIGAALGFGLHSIPEKNANDNWSGGSVSLRFTATMN